MVAPVGVDHPQLRHRGVSVLLVPEVVPAESQVGKGHGKAHGIEICFQLFLVPAGEPGDTGHVRRLFHLHLQSLRLLHGSHPGFHRVYQVPLDLLKLLVADLTLQADDLGGKHRRPLPLGEQLHALSGGVRPLVVLAGQVLCGKHPVFPRQGEVLPIHAVHGGLGKDGPGGGLELLLAQAGHVVTVQNADLFQPADPQVAFQVRKHVLGLDVEPFFLLYKYPCYHDFILSPAGSWAKSFL